MRDLHTRFSVALSLVFVCLLVGCEGGKSGGTTASAAKAPIKPSYASELQKLNAGIEHGIALAARQSGDTLIPLEIVSLYQERARLTGSYDDYAKAEALLARLGEEAKPSASRCLARAR